MWHLQNPPCVRIRMPWQVQIVQIKLVVGSLNFQIPRNFITRNLLNKAVLSKHTTFLTPENFLLYGISGEIHSVVPLSS